MSPPPGRCLLLLPPSPTLTPLTQKLETRTTPAPAVGRRGGGKNGEAPLRRKRPPAGPTPEGRRRTPLMPLLTTISSPLLTARLPRPNPSSRLRLDTPPPPGAGYPSTPCAKPATTAGATFVPWDVTWTNTTHISQMCAPPWWSATHRCPASTCQTPVPTRLQGKSNATLSHKGWNGVTLQTCHRVASRTSFCPRPHWRQTTCPLPPTRRLLPEVRMRCQCRF